MTFLTRQDFTYRSEARRVELFIPAGTPVYFVGTNGGIKTTTDYAVAEPEKLRGCDHFDARNYWYWIPNDLVVEAETVDRN